MRLHLRLAFLLSLVCLITWVQAAGAAVSARQVTMVGELLTGSRAQGQIGDFILDNGEIVLIISAIGHTTEGGENGGTIIDAGIIAERADGLGELYTYFDDDWPRQAYYTSLSIINDGSGGGQAMIRATGYDSQAAGNTVVTEYVLADGDAFLTLTTSLTPTGTLQDFELGDAFEWGDCSMYAPGYGYAVSGTTTQPWMGGISAAVSYAYGGSYGDNWGPHGNQWSDLSVVTADIGSGSTLSYTRYFAVAGADLAEAVAVLEDAMGNPIGTVISNVSDLATGLPLAGGLVNAYDTSGAPYLPMNVNGTGQALGKLPPGDWLLEATASGYLPEETWVTVFDGATHILDFLLEVGGGGTEEAIGDTLTVIQWPLVNIPALVLEGQTLAIQCSADPATTGWGAEITYDGLTFPMTISTAAYDVSTTWWTLTATVPAVSLHELYDLRVTADGGLDDTSHDAVQVISQFKDDYYFVQITDTHLPDHQFSDSGAVPADSTEIVDLREVIADLNVINPEFVLITGDFINEGELEDYMEWRAYTRAQRMLYEFQMPTFLIAGNHDIGGWNATPPPAGTARRDWWRFFGWPRLDDPPPGAPLYTQNYSFDYGPVHFVGLEAYDNYDLWRSEIYGSESFPGQQLTWLNQDLAAASGSLSQVLFYHYDFQGQLNLNSLGVEMALWGHVHGDRGNINTQPYDLATDNVCDGARSYRLIRVSGGTLMPQATLSAGAGGNTLRIDYSPANVGLAATVTAQITNTNAQVFEHGRLRFVMPPNGGHYIVSGGQMTQIDQSGPFDICYVAVNILAGGNQAVTVSPQVSDVPASPGSDLHANVPNPFNPTTAISFDVSRSGPVSLVIFDLSGKRVRTLVDGEVLVAGEHERTWDGTDEDGRSVAGGVYLYRLVAGDFERTRRMTLVK